MSESLSSANNRGGATKPPPRRSSPGSANLRRGAAVTARMITTPQINALAQAINMLEFTPGEPGKHEARTFIAYLAGIPTPSSIKSMTLRQAAQALELIGGMTAQREYRVMPAKLKEAHGTWLALSRPAETYEAERAAKRAEEIFAEFGR